MLPHYRGSGVRFFNFERVARRHELLRRRNDVAAMAVAMRVLLLAYLRIRKHGRRRLATCIIAVRGEQSKYALNDFSSQKQPPLTIAMTTQQYKTNLNCGKCVAAVKPYLDDDPAIDRWSVDTDNPDKVLTVEGENVSTANVQRHVSDAGFEVLGELNGSPAKGEAPATSSSSEPERSFLETYRPLLLVLAYLIGLVALVEVVAGSFDWLRAMANFMGGFFIAFSFFKMLDLRGFVDSFQTYDVLARPVRPYGYAYPFIELALGVAYLVRFAPIATNAVTLVVMLIGIVGVTQALLKKQQIQCACLGTVFNLPMSKVTFIEDGTMAAMAAAMLVMLLV